MNDDEKRVLSMLLGLHDAIRSRVVTATEQSSVEAQSSVSRDDEGDTIYAIDEVGERLLLENLEPHARALGGIALVAEGLEGGLVCLPRGASEADARLRVIIDPIDGTRGLMFQKRSAWILSAVAVNRGPETRASDIFFALMTEIPLLKQHLCDRLWVFRGTSVVKERFDRVANQTRAIELGPSRARSIAHGFSMLSRFVPGARDVLAAIDDEIAKEVLGPPIVGKAQCFEDQYLSTGGQLYELSAGHDRFNADLRPLLSPLLEKQNLALPLCCHPYDLCTMSIAQGLGVVLTAADGGPLDFPLRVEPNLAWVGYANEHIRAAVEPALQRALKSRGLL